MLLSSPQCMPQVTVGVEKIATKAKKKTGKVKDICKTKVAHKIPQKLDPKMSVY